MALGSLVSEGLGSFVEACDSAVPVLVGLLRNGADQGAHALGRTVARNVLHDMGEAGQDSDMHAWLMVLPPAY